MCPRCNAVFDRKAAEQYEEAKKKAVPRFLFDSKGNPRRNSEYQSNSQSSRPRTFIPPSDTPPEKWVEEVSQKGSKRPKWKVMEGGKAPELADEKEGVQGYMVSPNYQGKNPMTRTQWRRHQRNKKSGKGASSSGTKPVEPAKQKGGAPQKKWVKKEKIKVNQTIAMTVDKVGKSSMVSNQNTKRSSDNKKAAVPEYTPQAEEKPDYTPLAEDKEPEYTPQEDEEFDDYLYDENHDDTYGEDFVVNCGIVSVLPAAFDMVSEVSETEEEFVSTEDDKPLFYYVMNSGVVEEQQAMFERPTPGMMFHLKPLFIQAKIDGIAINKVFIDGGAVVNLMPLTVLKRLGKSEEDLRPHNMVL